jgi:F-type H+-transporting ATPase subunit b
VLAAMAIVVMASAEGGGSALTNLDLNLFVWTFVLFGLFAFVLGRFGWKPLLNIIEERERSVREAIENARRANAEAQALLARHQEMLRNAGREREEILTRAIQEAEKIRADLVTKAKAEAEEQIERAREEIQREARRALVEVRTQVADMAVDAAAKIVTSSLTPAAQKKLAEEFIAGLPQLD